MQRGSRKSAAAAGAAQEGPLAPASPADASGVSMGHAAGHGLLGPSGWMNPARDKPGSVLRGLDLHNALPDVDRGGLGEAEHLGDLVWVARRRVVYGCGQLVQTLPGLRRANVEGVRIRQRAGRTVDVDDLRSGDKALHRTQVVHVLAIQRDHPFAADNGGSCAAELPGQLDGELVIRLEQQGLLVLLGRIEHVHALYFAVKDSGYPEVRDWRLECARFK